MDVGVSTRSSSIGTKAHKQLKHDLIDLTLHSSAEICDEDHGEPERQPSIKRKPGRQPNVKRKREREMSSEEEESCRARVRRSKKRADDLTLFSVAERKFANLPNDVNEQQLQEQVISSMERQHWHLKAREYDLVPGNSSFGKGDLLFENEQVSVWII